MGSVSVGDEPLARPMPVESDGSSMEDLCPQPLAARGTRIEQGCCWRVASSWPPRGQGRFGWGAFADGEQGT
eukprot:6439015-Lingulodinium_polyedra.AAC.1